MKTRIPKGILAGLLALIVATPLAAASDADKYSGATASCDLNTCNVNVNQNAFSYASNNHCTYAGTTLVSCEVYHWCQAQFTMLVGTGTLSCYNTNGGYSSGACAVTTETQCSTSAFYTTVMARGTCAWFYADATVTSLGGSKTANAPGIQICITSSGPR